MNYLIQSLTMISLALTSAMVSASEPVDKVPSNEVRIFDGTQFGFKNPEAIAIDADDNVWITNDDSITKIPANNPKTPTVYQESSYQFNKPRAIAIDKIRKIVWVANFKGNSVTKIPVDYPEGSKVYQGEDFKFMNPNGIAVDTKGNVFVSSASAGHYKDYHVTKMPVDNPNKPVIYQNGDFGFAQTYALATDAEDNLWVTTGYYHNVVKIPANYPESKPVVFPYTDPRPGSITIDNKGNVWVVNSWPNPSQGNSVLKLPAENPNNPIVYRDNKYGFDYPRAITTDAEGNVWVTNSRGNSVTKIPVEDPEHPIIYEGARYGFKFPCGIAVDSSGNVWVVNAEGNSVTEILADSKKD